MIVTPLCYKIFVRYARKPIWMPTAKSKLFRIAEHTFYSPEEVKQIRMLQNAYKAQEKSIQEFMKHEFYIPASQSGGLPSEFISKEAEKDRQLYEENDRINAEIGKMKQDIIGKNFRELEQKVLDEKRRAEEQLLMDAQKIDDYILEHKSDPDAFVTPENIDSMIEKAIGNPVSFEHFIDTSGRRYNRTCDSKAEHLATSRDT